MLITEYRVVLPMTVEEYQVRSIMVYGSLSSGILHYGLFPRLASFLAWSRRASTRRVAARGLR